MKELMFFDCDNGLSLKHRNKQKIKLPLILDNSLRCLELGVEWVLDTVFGMRGVVGQM